MGELREVDRVNTGELGQVVHKEDWVYCGGEHCDVQVACGRLGSSSTAECGQEPDAMALAQCVEPAVGSRVAQTRQSLCRCCHPRILARGCGRFRP